MESMPALGSGYVVQTRDRLLTDRLLELLPGPRPLWMVAWAVLPQFHFVVLAQVLRITGYAGSAGFWTLVTARLPSHVAQSYMIIVALWASRRLITAVRELQPTIEDLCPTHEDPSTSPFAGMTSIAGPLGLTVLLTLGESIETAIKGGVGPAILFSPYLALWILPMMTLFWVYISFLIGLDRLGRRQMHLGSFPEDLSLGLGPIGAKVFDAFLIFCAFAVPFLLASLWDSLDLIFGLAFFGVGVGAFFLSVWRLHRQMVETKRAHVSRAGRLYSETFEPLEMDMTPATLQACAPRLNAAEALVRRALAIQEWPLDDRTITRIVAISTGVATAIIARSILSAIGL